MDRKHKSTPLLLAFLIAISTTCALAVNDAAQNEYKKGRDFALHGNDKQSLQALGESIRLDPKYAPTYLWRARVLNRLRRYKEALENCNSIMDP
jgi:tetratricopeptide (TPR) repeat protein